ncbi:hypothetical protein B0H12DRAFT_1232646 [Mycena haematopus]|nr:hypothetical protein B0H12DRAFT_1232646 [Mycena haematopus]
MHYTITKGTARAMHGWSFILDVVLGFVLHHFPHLSVPPHLPRAQLTSAQLRLREGLAKSKGTHPFIHACMHISVLMLGLQPFSRFHVALSALVHIPPLHPVAGLCVSPTLSYTRPAPAPPSRQSPTANFANVPMRVVSTVLNISSNAMKGGLCYDQYLVVDACLPV